MATTIKDVMAYFEMPVPQFSKEWKELTPEDKTQIKDGIDNGSLTY